MPRYFFMNRLLLAFGERIQYVRCSLFEDLCLFNTIYQLPWPISSSFLISHSHISNPPQIMKILDLKIFFLSFCLSWCGSKKNTPKMTSLSSQHLNPSYRKKISRQSFDDYIHDCKKYLGVIYLLDDLINQRVVFWLGGTDRTLKRGKRKPCCFFSSHYHSRSEKERREKETFWS